MLVTITINLWWLVWLAVLVYIVVSVLGACHVSGICASEMRLYQRYGKRYTLARYLAWSCGRTWRWVFLPAHLLTYGLGWLIARRPVRPVAQHPMRNGESEA